MGNGDAIAKEMDVYLGILRSLLHVLQFWCPALFRLGYQVRQCYWEGRPGGAVTGRHARAVVWECLLLQAHLSQDWDARTEYCRTMAVALATWHPWLLDRPGCMFVEEAGEALLSRFMGRVRKHPELSGYEGAYRLYITLQRPGQVATPTRGAIRGDLVLLIRDRVVALVHGDGHLPFPEILNVGTGTGVWRERFPDGFTFPEDYPGTFDAGRLRQLLQSAVGTLSTGPLQRASLQDWLDQNVPGVSLVQERSRQEVHRVAARWVRQRTERLRLTRASQGPQPTPKPNPKAPASNQRAPTQLSQSSVAIASPSATLATDTSTTSTAGSDEQDLVSELGSECPCVSFGDSDGLGSVGDLDADRGPNQE